MSKNKQALDAFEELQKAWVAHCELHDIDLPDDEDGALIRSYAVDVKNYLLLNDSIIIAAQIDKVCDMALDPEACAEHRLSALKTIQEINRQRAAEQNGVVSVQQTRDETIKAIYSAWLNHMKQKEPLSTLKAISFIVDKIIDYYPNGLRIIKAPEKGE